jgi:hypothetical protein
MRRQVLARVRLARVDEVPAVLRVLGCELVEQRTLCRAVRSGEGAELEHHPPLAPELGQANAVAVEQCQVAVGCALAGVQHVWEGGELALVHPALDVGVELLVVVAVHREQLR